MPPGELMFQAYYRAHLVAGTYLQPVISYIPTPGAGADLPPAWAATMQITVLFCNHERVLSNPTACSIGIQPMSRLIGRMPMPLI